MTAKDGNIASMVRGWHQQGVFIALVDDQLEVFGEPSVVQQYAAAIRQHKEAVVACMKTAQEQRTRLETLALASWCKPDCKHLLRSKMASGEQALWCRQYRNNRSWSQRRLCILKGCPNVLGEENIVSVTETQIDSEKTTVSGCSGTQRKEKKRTKYPPLPPRRGERKSRAVTQPIE